MKKIIGRRVLVECKFQIWVEADDLDEESLHFMIEENSCPGTGRVWAALSDCMEKHDEQSTCWACALHGENRIVKVEPCFDADESTPQQ